MTEAELKAQVASLGSNDPVTRELARHALVRVATPEVTVALVGELLDPRDHVRWEAAKALTALREPVTASALLEALDDNNPDIRWVAAEGLVAVGRPGLLATLHGLTKKSRAIGFYKAAHHVLHEFTRQGLASDTIAPVLKALEQQEPGV